MRTFTVIRRTIAPLLTSGMLAIAGCTKGDANAVDSTAPDTSAAEAAAPTSSSLSLPVAVSAARDGDLILTVSTTGQVRSDAEAQLKADVGGTVQSVDVRPGGVRIPGAQLEVVAMDGRRVAAVRVHRERSRVPA